MIIVKIVGGLTSQMHKYALGRVLSLKYNVPLKLDLTWFDKPSIDTPWEYQLDYFKINASVATSKEIKRLKGNDFYNKIARRIEKFFSVRIYKKSYINKSFISKIEFDKLEEDIYLDGEFAGFRYFEDFEEIIKSEFTLKNELNIKFKKLIEELNLNENTVFLHIRRGDYISNKYAATFHSLCNLDYYYEAINIIKEKIEKPIFYIFSDDISWAKENLLIEEPCIFIEKNQNFEDLILMSYCKYGIAANSGFSLMAAWLNSNKNKITIIPSNWVNNKKVNKFIIDSLKQDNFRIVE
ncbi:alpha-1,2-fucosyltransferase [Aliarcobacter butzleri]|uniref:alpha-1,2-fucosyltransferase n=1 Tax=Aliarcobacter butzleri TaxID=28197 RepID=UPI0021B38A41|nr:alpha-1,2-fucosyltransferase [Aliarcobacter butzleri]MCT7568966.1 alpha-1,2-fucosyltransferase [Aliarcobacter butzleri]